jgi:23S rRNA (guanosine2251-2'-O)-methyltransferase
MRVITGFHAIEEEVRALKDKSADGCRVVYDKPGPRVKKIVAEAESLGIPTARATTEELDRLVSSLPATARDHRGIAMVKEKDEGPEPVRLDEAIRALKDKETSLVLILDSITAPHNVGAIIRSADQFAVDLVIMPERRSASDFGVIGRTSSGASSWVPCALTPNLARACDALKDAGFWIYGADAGGKTASSFDLSGKVCLVMGSEGEGIGRLLKDRCDGIISIPTNGRLDSLNVSVAAGILLYEATRQRNGRNG